MGDVPEMGSQSHGRLREALGQCGANPDVCGLWGRRERSQDEALRSPWRMPYGPEAVPTPQRVTERLPWPHFQRIFERR